MSPITEVISAQGLQFISLANDIYIHGTLKHFGQYCTDESELLSDYIAETSTVLDIGANIGTHTLKFAQKASRGHVLAFEAQRFVHQILCGNVALNGFDNVKPYYSAVAKECGEIRVPLLTYDWADNYGGYELRVQEGHYGKFDYEAVPAITIDSLNLSAADLFKVDVESMEEEVLRGAIQTICKFTPTMYIEAQQENCRPGLLQLLEVLGYRVWEHRPPLVKGEAPLVRPFPADMDEKATAILRAIKAYVAINFLCLHKDRPQPTAEQINRFKLKSIL